MMRVLMWGKFGALLGMLLALFAAEALAQAFPAKPITLICPWPPGGSTDQHLRKFAEIAAKHIGQNIIIENKPGAKWGEQTFKSERSTIERVGLLAK
jgi:tripartite-type tricarboxylate transporter receptor subunit TctC